MRKVPYLNKPLYESLPALYAALGAVLLWASYHFRESWWSALCALAGFVALIGGLAVWMHRRDYRATSADYLRRGRPVVEPHDEA
jgi:polyferredoxin